MAGDSNHRGSHLVFSSLLFLYIFLPLCLAFYFLVPLRSWKNAVLILFSLIFYAWGEPVFVVLLLASSLVDYFLARVIERHRGQVLSKIAVGLSLSFNLGVLVLFKYSGFFLENINLTFGLSLPIVEFHLPLGISFYTFQTISYVIDVYRHEVPAQKHYPLYLLYLSLFHQLVAGPIVRYKDVEGDIRHRLFSWSDMAYGIRRFSYGLIKKVLLANTLGEVAARFLQGDASVQSILGSWWAILLFALQIFFDFSAYSDMAIGLGRMFGFHYKENFNYPYIARSATDFWRRWHMSLGSFFRDYVYIPLGGNRKRGIFNLFLVWFLTGFWHGAHWNFIAWGLYYGLLIFLERWVTKTFKWEAPAPLGHLYLILITLVGWNLFYLDKDVSGFINLGQMFGFGNVPWVNEALSLQVHQNIFILLLGLMAALPWAPALRSRWQIRRPGLVQFWDQTLGLVTAVGLVGLSTLLLVGSSYNPFLYFRF